MKRKAKAKPAPIKRPYSTHYFTLRTDTEAHVVSHGASSSEQGAIRAAIVRVFLGQFQKAVIFDRHRDVALYNIRPGAGGLQVRYGSGVDFAQWEADAARRRAEHLARLDFAAKGLDKMHKRVRRAA